MCKSEKVAVKLGPRFEGTRMVFPIRRSAMAGVADRRELPLEQQTCALGVAFLAPFAPVEGKLALAVLPDVDGVPIIGSKSMKDRFRIDIMVILKDNGAREGREMVMS